MGTVYHGRVYVLYICASKNNIKKKKALTLLCSVVKDAGSGQSKKEEWGKDDTQSSVSPYFLSVLFCFVFEHEAIYTIRVFAMLSFIDLCQITISLSVKTFKSRTVHFSFGLWLVHVIRTSIIELGMFTNLCLVLPLLLARLL